MILLAAIPELGEFLSKLWFLALLLIVVIVGMLFIRRPIVRRRIRNSLPAGTAEIVIEKKVTSSQRRAGMALWFFLFLLPICVILAIIVANDMH